MLIVAVKAFALVRRSCGIDQGLTHVLPSDESCARVLRILRRCQRSRGRDLCRALRMRKKEVMRQEHVSQPGCTARRLDDMRGALHSKLDVYSVAFREAHAEASDPGYMM